MFSPEVVGPMVDFLAALAGDGAALEFGIGTGRVALPLARRGDHVHGSDLSGAMVAKLREKPGAEQIGTTIGDFATTRVEGTFSLVYDTKRKALVRGRPVTVHPCRPPGCLI
jgi:predicted TPR repeat methyltransferase